LKKHVAACGSAASGVAEAATARDGAWFSSTFAATAADTDIAKSAATPIIGIV